MDKSPLCTCLMKQDLEEAADPYEFLDKNYSISGILDNLDKLSPKESVSYTHLRAHET